MKTLNKLRWSGACLGLCLASVVLWSRPAVAEVKLVETDGWTFSFDGRVNSFLSGGRGNDFPQPTPGQMHTVMGSNSQAANGVPDVGWLGAYQQDINDKYSAIRVRSGMLGNILGFGLAKQVSDTVVLKAYVALWSTVETLARDKFAPITAEARVGYFTASAPWGTLTLGRMLAQFGRSGYEIDLAYGHGFGVGLPCTDALGPACGHVGTGALFPGYSAGVVYTTPLLFNTLQISYGAYDPVVFASTAVDWSRAPYPRQEGTVTISRPFGEMGNFKLSAEGAFQPIRRIASVMDPTTNAVTTKNIDSSIWGVSGGARVELGPLRVGVSGFRGRGTGLGNAFQRSVAIADDDSSVGDPNPLTYNFRTFTGFYGQLGARIQQWQLAAGYGMGIVDQLAADKADPNLSVIHTQTGISAAVYYHVSDAVVIGLDYFHFKASWYGAPIVDMNGPTGGKLVGELQNLDFLNLGATYYW